MLSQTVEYALRAYLYVARRAPRTAQLAEIARDIHAPTRYLAKILAQLTKAGYLHSARGPAGGYRLPSRQERVTLADIAAVFEPALPRRCLLGDGVCGRNPMCPVHERWAPISNSMAAFFANTAIDDLLPHAPPVSPSNSF